MNVDELLGLTEVFRLAYNAVDIETLGAAVADDIQWGHQNRFKGAGRDGLLNSVREFADKMPGRYFDAPIRYAANGTTIFVEHRWHAVPVESGPAWGWEKGVAFSMGTCSVFVIRDGKIVEWTDYG